MDGSILVDLPRTLLKNAAESRAMSEKQSMKPRMPSDLPCPSMSIPKTAYSASDNLVTVPEEPWTIED